MNKRIDLSRSLVEPVEFIPREAPADWGPVLRGTTRIETVPLTGTYSADTSAVDSGWVIVGEPDPALPGCRQVAAVEIETGRLFLGQRHLTEPVWNALPVEDLVAEAGAVAVGTLDVPVATEDPAYPFMAALSLSRALGGLTDDTHSILETFGRVPAAPAEQIPAAPAKGRIAFDAADGSIVTKFAYNTDDARYFASFRIEGSVKTGDQSPKVQVAAALAALIFGVPCPEAKAIQVSALVDVTVRCVSRKAGADGMRNGWEVTHKQTFNGSAAVGNELCEIVNVFIDAQKRKQAQDAKKSGSAG